jgi:hypothetical protein
MNPTNDGGRLAHRAAVKFTIDNKLKNSTIIDLATFRQRRRTSCTSAARSTLEEHLATVQWRMFEGAISPGHAAQAAVVILALLA